VGQETPTETGIASGAGRAFEKGPKAELIVVQQMIDLRIVRK